MVSLKVPYVSHYFEGNTGANQRTTIMLTSLNLSMVRVSGVSIPTLLNSITYLHSPK